MLSFLLMGVLHTHMQHGIASGYYLTFFMGALITSAARLARTNIRPLFLSPSPLGSLKPIYDLFSTAFSIAILNYSAAPFIISTWDGSITTWRVLNWYGHIVVVGGLVFFYVGGTRWLRGVQKSCGVLPPASAANGKTPAAASGTSTPVSEKNFMGPPPVDAFVRP